MKNLYTILSLAALFIVPMLTKAQQEDAAIRQGNKLYHQGQFDKALPEYQKALEQNPKNAVARYNLANARYRNNKFEDAEKSFDDVIDNTTDNKYKEKSYYNKGVALSKEKKLQESIDAWKKALRLDPNDADARFNLQKALKELQKQSNTNNQKQQQKQKQQPQQKQQNKLDKKKIEQYLKSLEQKEQEVQKKMQQNRARSVTQPEKDW